LRSISASAAIFLTAAAFVVSKTGRDALYFQGDGLFDLPKAYIGIASLSLPMTLLLLALMQRIGTRQARVAIAAGMALALVVIGRVARPGGGPLMTLIFMLIPLVFGLVFSSTWLLAADLLEDAERKERARAYSAIGAASILGGALGALLARTLSKHVEPQFFFGLGALGLALAALIMETAHRFCPRRSILRAGRLSAPTARDYRLLFEERYARLLLIIAMLASLAGLLIEFQFYLSAATSGHGGRANASFFATFYFTINVAALAVQVLMIPRLQTWFGVYGCLFILPATLFGGVAALLVSASGLGRSFLRVAEGSLKSSVHRVSWEQAYLPLSRTQRAVAKMIVDGLGSWLAEAAGAGIIAVWLHFMIRNHDLVGRSTAWMGWMLLGVVLLWLALTRALGRNLSHFSHAREMDAADREDIPVPDRCVRAADLDLLPREPHQQAVDRDSR